MSDKAKIPAISYLRTSSAAKVGADKDSDRRQREAIQAFARRAGHEVVDEFYDAAVSGADHIDARPGFADMLERVEGNGVRTGDLGRVGGARFLERERPPLCCGVHQVDAQLTARAFSIFPRRPNFTLSVKQAPAVCQLFFLRHDLEAASAEKRREIIGSTVGPCP